MDVSERGEAIATLSEPHDLFLRCHQTIDQAIRAFCRRDRMRAEDAEDFAGTVHLHLIREDCLVLRRFQGRSSLSTYILTVVTHLGQDWRNARWGKWRPSTDARRLGPIAIHLERLIRRDGLTFDEAFETLRVNFRVRETRAELEAMAVALPRVPRKRLLADHLLENRPASGPSPEQLADGTGASRAASEMATVLARAVAKLPAEDALVLKLRFNDGLRIVDIARALGLEPKGLYRRIDRVLLQLRRDLEMAGVNPSVIRDLLVRQGFAPEYDRPGVAALFATAGQLRGPSTHACA